MNKPKIRFRGFEGEWKEKVFSQFVNRISCPGQAGNLPGVEYEDIVAGEGMLNKSIQEKSCNKYGIKFKEGDVLFGKLRPYLKNILLTDFEGVAIGDFWVLRPSKCDSKFLYSLVISNDFMKIANISSGSKMPRADWNLISSTSISLPSLPEQRAIASYFTSLDAQIAASTSRLSSLKQIKAASLLNMFPQKGETVPRVRFKGFEGEWKKVKIGDVAPLTGGFAFQSGQFKTSGVPIIRISNILSSGIVGGDFVYYNEFKGDSEFRLYKGDVVIAMSGATTGKVATFEANDFGYQNQRVGKFSRTNLVNYELLSKLVSAPNFQKKIISKLTSSAQPNASSKDIDSIDLVVPEETEEQRAIASYFTALDAQITLHRERLEKLKQIKAACLEKMFA